jgi:hypothetical protein
MPKHTGQSLGLTGRYIYFLFKPTPNKYFSIHIDISTCEKVIVRVSFSNLFKELKTTSSWLQFPYVIQAPCGSVYEKAEMTAKDLTGAAPPVTKWTILCVDLPALMQTYSNRTYHSVRGFKLCASMLVKNVVTSDILYEPGLTFAEAKLRNGAVSSFPRELAYPCEKYDNWHVAYDLVAFPGESFRRPFDSVGQSSRILVPNSSNPTKEPRLATTKQVFTQSSHPVNVNNRSGSAINEMTNPKKQFAKKGGVFNLPLVGVESEPKTSGSTGLKSNSDEDIHFVSPQSFEKQNQQDIHVYPSIRNENNEEFFSPSGSSVSGSNSNTDLACEFDENLKIIGNQETDPSMRKLTNGQLNQVVSNYRTSLEPDPILRLKKIIGFGSRNVCSNQSLSSSNTVSNFTNIFKWSRDSQYIVYGCQAICIAYHVNTNAQYCFVGHSDRVSCLTISPDSSIIASGQAGPYSLVRLWDFQTRKCISIFRNHDHSLYLLEYSFCGNYICGVGKDKQGKTLVILWDVRGVRDSKSNESNFVKVVAKAHTDVHINRLVFVHFDSSRIITCGRDNVRFWRLRNDSLRSCAVNLSPYVNALSLSSFQTENDDNEDAGKTPLVYQKPCLDFTDICVNMRADNNENLAYACTRTGQIFVFNMAKCEIENVRVLEPVVNKTGILASGSSPVHPSLRLNSLAVSDSFCATGSEDGYVRIWTLDFSQVSVEAEHEAAIGLVRFSPDCFKIATATVNGNLGKNFLTILCDFC